jgi:hypothetical protein
MQINQPITIKIPVKAASVLVSKRKRRGHYVTTGKALNTNRLEKWFGFYFALKALTTSGKIHDLNKQIDLIKTVTRKESTSTIYSYIRACTKLGLMQKVGTDLELVSWLKCGHKIGLTEDNESKIKFIEFEYPDATFIKATPEFHIEAAEIAESSHFSLRAIAKKINQNVQLKLLLGIKPEQNATIQDAKKLFDLQMQSFVTGKSGDLVTSEEDYKVLHSVQACPYRTAEKLIAARKQGNLKSTAQHIAYIKRKLSESGLASVNELTCTSKQKKRANETFYYRGWDSELKAPKWYLPDEVEVFAKVA